MELYVKYRRDCQVKGEKWIITVEPEKLSHMMCLQNA